MNIYKKIVKYKNEILFLSQQTVRKQYAETTFGSVWAIMQPLVYMLTFYLFYRIGLRTSGDIDGYPFFLYIFAANTPWLFLSQSFTQGTKIFIQNAAMMKTINFPVVTLPLIDVLAKLYVHIVVVFITIIFFVANGYLPGLHYLNFIYYWLLMVFFLTSISFLLASLSVLFKDIPQLISSIMMPLFWSTPIIWAANGKVELLEKIFNPFYYFIHEYRNTLLEGKMFWTEPLYDIYFLFVCIILFLVGSLVYKKIRPVLIDYL